MDDDERLAEIGREYGSGRMLSGEIKKELIDCLTPMIVAHQEARAKVSDAHVDQFFSTAPRDFASMFGELEAPAAARGGRRRLVPGIGNPRGDRAPGPAQVGKRATVKRRRRRARMGNRCRRTRSRSCRRRRRLPRRRRRRQRRRRRRRRRRPPPGTERGTERTSLACLPGIIHIVSCRYAHEVCVSRRASRADAIPSTTPVPCDARYLVLDVLAVSSRVLLSSSSRVVLLSEVHRGSKPRASFLFPPLRRAPRVRQRARGGEAGDDETQPHVTRESSRAERSKPPQAHGVLFPAARAYPPHWFPYPIPDAARARRARRRACCARAPRR